MKHRIKVFLLTAGLLLAAAPSFSFALTPKAGIRGPTSGIITVPGQPENPITLRFVGCVADSADQLQLAYEGPEKGLNPAFFYDANGRLAIAEVIVAVPGPYVFTIVAEGVPDGEKKSRYATASLFVNITDPGVIPVPVPTPGPAPAPTPGPTPVPPNPAPPIPPVPADIGVVWVSIISDATTKTQAFAQLQADETLRTFVDALPGHLMYYDVSNKDVDTLGLRRFVNENGVPTLIIQGTKTKSFVAVKCPETAAGVTAAVNQFRGK